MRERHDAFRANIDLLRDALAAVEERTGLSSGCSLKQATNVQLKIAPYQAPRAGKYVELPECVKAKRCVYNPQNKNYANCVELCLNKYFELSGEERIVD